MVQSPLRSFRLVCKRAHIAQVEALLTAQGFLFTEEPFSGFARRLVREPFPLGSSIAARFGYVYVQDRSSMLPPLALAPEAGAAVLDMCASPGSKTGFLGQMVGDDGFVLANEPSGSRLGTLRRNMQQLNLLCCATSSHPGERIPLPGPGEPLDEPQAACEGWRAILLDPPCSGWGTVDKHPKAALLWQGDKIRPLIILQRRLLAEAARLLAPGGMVCYSTCTTNVEENEEQICHAVEKLGLALVPAAPPAGFALADPALPSMEGVLRVRPGPDGQGFFVALLQKTHTRAGAHGVDEQQHGGEAESSPPLDRGFFVRPWERGSRFVGERRRHGRGFRGNAAGPAILDPLSLEGPLLESARLPDGDLAVYSDIIHFLPAARFGLIPARFAWKGHPIGRLGRGGEARASLHLRALMPDAATAACNGAAVCNADDTAPLLDLLSGQSLAVGGNVPELGLYFRDLPLCRLPVKNGRAVLPSL